MAYGDLKDLSRRRTAVLRDKAFNTARKRQK